MFFTSLIRLIVLHAGTPVALSQVTLTLMFVVLGILLVGIAFGLVKNKESFLQHRWSMTAAIFLALIAIFFVMIPSAFRFYVDPDVEFFSTLSILTIIHGFIGVPAVVIAVIYAFGDLPLRVKQWMRRAAVFWVVSFVFGAIVFLYMLGFLSLSM